ncbi:hypothetical protein TNCV_3627231 [Trichonephila clavipes]|nr:hypothetical protein TNCV_3627231 [Trichonephila clavipes]
MKIPPSAGCDKVIKRRPVGSDKKNWEAPHWITGIKLATPCSDYPQSRGICRAETCVKELVVFHKNELWAKCSTEKPPTRLFSFLKDARLCVALSIVNIDGLCCSGKSLSLGSGNEGKREIVLNRRPELYRGKYRCVQPKINLLKRRSYACEKQCFPVEPSDVEEVPSHDGETV